VTKFEHSHMAFSLDTVDIRPARGQWNVTCRRHCAVTTARPDRSLRTVTRVRVSVCPRRGWTPWSIESIRHGCPRPIECAHPDRVSHGPPALASGRPSLRRGGCSTSRRWPEPAAERLRPRWT